MSEKNGLLTHSKLIQKHVQEICMESYLRQTQDYEMHLTNQIFLSILVALMTLIKVIPFDRRKKLGKDCVHQCH